MKHSKHPKVSKNGESLRDWIHSFAVMMGIALIIRAGVVYPFKIPTGSMEGSLLVGDHILCNKFVYGIRTPDWIGIPYTKLGFFIPFFRTPGFRNPQSGDVVVFKYPRDLSLYYIKRCIAVSGDTVEIRDKRTFVNGQAFENAPGTKFISTQTLLADVVQRDIFPPGAGNVHNYGPIRVPSPGDIYRFEESNRDQWFEHFQLMVYEGNRLTINHRGETVQLTPENIDRWPMAIRVYPLDTFAVNGQPLAETVYTVKYRQHFMMGDNRDNSLDSRFWGFVPERNIVGEGLVTFWSWDDKVPFYRIWDKVRLSRIFNVIR